MSFSGTLTETGYIALLNLKLFYHPYWEGLLPQLHGGSFSAHSPLLVIHIAPFGKRIPLSFSATLTETGYISKLNLKLLYHPYWEGLLPQLHWGSFLPPLRCWCFTLPRRPTVFIKFLGYPCCEGFFSEPDEQNLFISSLLRGVITAALLREFSAMFAHGGAVLQVWTLKVANSLFSRTLGTWDFQFGYWCTS